MAQQNDVDVVVQEKYTFKKIHLGLQKQFGDYLNLKYFKNEEKIDSNEQREFDEVVQLGIWQKRKDLQSDSILLHKGKKPRKDVWGKLGSIASLFLSYSTYPHIHGCALPTTLNTALGDVDYRVYRDYRKTVLLYCNFDNNVIDRAKDSMLGQLDVSSFVKQIPKQYITTSSTSSFGEELER